MKKLGNRCLAMLLIAGVGSGQLGCGARDADRYVTVASARGSLYRLNRSTVEMDLIAGTEMTRVTQAADRRAAQALEEERRQKRAKEKVWSGISLAMTGIPRARLSTVWRSGAVYCKLVIESAPPALRTARTGSLTVELLDKHGFQVATISVGVDDITRIVDDHQKAIGYSVQLHTPMTGEDYDRITDWTVMSRL